MTSEAIRFGQASSDHHYQNAEYGDDYDEPDQEEDFDEPGTRMCTRSRTKQQQVSSDVAGLIHFYFLEARRILTQPSAFFTEMPTSGGFAEPALFLAASAAIYAAITAIGAMHPLVFFAQFLSSITYVTAGAFIASQILSLGCGGKGTFESTFRVFAYSKATLLFAWIAVGTFPIGGWSAVAYSLLLNIFGIVKVHKLPAAQVTGIVLVMAVLEIMIKILVKF